MDFAPSAKELSHFPFLKKAQDHIKARFSSLDSLLKDTRGEVLISLAIERIEEALSPKKLFAPVVSDSADDEIAAYAACQDNCFLCEGQTAH